MKRFVLSAVALIAVAAGSQAQPTRPGGNTGGLTGQALTNKDLQAELKITDDQKAKFKDVAAKQEEAGKKLRELFTGGGGRPDRAKMQEITAEMTKVGEEAKKVADEALTAEQKKRLKQIEVQQLGLRAFTNADVVKELKITDEQKAKIKEVTDAAQKEMPTFTRPMPGTTPDPEKTAADRKKRTEVTEKATEKVAALLDDAQKKTWAELTGPKFDLTKLTTGFGGGRAPKN